MRIELSPAAQYLVSKHPVQTPVEIIVTIGPILKTVDGKVRSALWLGDEIVNHIEAADDNELREIANKFSIALFRWWKDGILINDYIEIDHD